MSMLETEVGDLAATVPGATRVFRKYGIDFCCGGRRSLEAVCAQKQLDGGAIARELAGLERPEVSITAYTTAPIDTLVQHILDDYHAKHRAELPELVRLAERVERVHASHPSCPRGLADALRETTVELELHMQKEERVLFPMILGGAGRATSGPISVMEMEHDAHGERLRNLEAMAHGFEVPADGCNTWRALYRGLRQLVDDLMEHIHLENNVLFPRVLGGSPSSPMA